MNYGNTGSQTTNLCSWGHVWRRLRRVFALACCSRNFGNSPRPKPEGVGAGKAAVGYLGTAPESESGGQPSGYPASRAWKYDRHRCFGKRPDLFTVAWKQSLNRKRNDIATGWWLLGYFPIRAL